MLKFLDAFQDKITGVLSCFDRLIFRGHLPVSSSEGMEAFLLRQGLLFKDLKQFLPRHADRLKQHAKAMAEKSGRPFAHLSRHVRKEDLARKMAREDGVENGLVCIFSVVEPCRSFSLRYGEGRPRLVSTDRKCLFLYYYMIDREFGLMHVRLQTWFPLQVQVYVNGHEWLARKLDKHGINYRRVDNAFTSVEDVKRAQKFADRMASKSWVRILDTFAKRVNPLLGDLLEGRHYYWVTDQAEYSTDVMFRDRPSLQTVYPKLLRHSTLCFSAEDVLTFLGRKLTPQFAGEVLNDCKHRWPGARVKHRVKENWIKMYDKHGCVLRIETVINHPKDFKIRRPGFCKGEQVVAWYPMAKRVCNLYRYAEISLQANRRYLDSLAAVADPGTAHRFLHKVCEPAAFNGRKVRGFNPISQGDVQLFKAALRGEHDIRGFCNGDIARHLHPHGLSSQDDKKRSSARISRLLQRMRAHSLIAKIPRTRRYRATDRGKALMSAAILLREEELPKLLRIG